MDKDDGPSYTKAVSVDDYHYSATISDVYKYVEGFDDVWVSVTLRTFYCENLEKAKELLAKLSIVLYEFTKENDV